MFFFLLQVKGNILKVFSKFLNEGKTTISFSVPAHDLMIKADDIIQLKSFLNSIRMVLQGKQLSKGAGGLSTLNSNIKTHRPKTKLVITSKSDYPVLEGFPRTLLQLHVIIILFLLVHRPSKHYSRLFTFHFFYLMSRSLA